MKLGRWRVERVRPDGMTAVEVWNWPLEGGLLWELVGTPRVEALRQAGLGELEVGSLLAQALAPALGAMAERLGATRAHLGGGLTDLAGFRAALTGRTALPLSFAADGQWLSQAGGLGLLRDRDVPDGAVLEVGQTSIKGVAGGRRQLRTRELALLPRRFITEDGTSRGAPTAPVATFVAEALIDLLREANPADPALILGLPCPVGDDCALGACSYGWQGDGELLPRIFAIVDERLHPWPNAQPLVLLLNDAELFAESARRELPAPAGSAVLCLSLGFGPGGAVLKT